MTHASAADSPLAVDEAPVRLSVGIESVGDLLADLDRALSEVTSDEPAVSTTYHRRSEP